MMMNNVRSMLLNGQQQHTMVAAAATLLHCFSSSAPRQIVYHHNVESSLLAFSSTCNSRPQPNIFSRFSKFASKLQQQQQRQAVISSAVPEKDLPRERVHEHGIVCSEFPPVSVQSEPISDTLQAAIWRHSLEQPEHPAFISAHDPNERISYDDLLRQCHFVSDFLDSIGFGRGDVAGVILRNTWHFLAIFLGATLRGGCITGANIQLTNDEIARQMKLANCRVVFCEDSLLNRMCAIKEMYPEMEHLVLVPSEPSAKPLANLPPNIHNWAELEQSRPNTIGIRPAHADIDVNRDMAFLPFSSGTTGAGKGVMLSHKSVGTMLRILNNHFDNYVVKRMDPNWDWTSENSMMILPLYHIYGFVNSLNNLLCGSTGIIFKKFDLELFCRIVQDYKIKQVSMVPPILVYLAKSPELLARFDLSSLRLIMTGAAPLGEDLYHEVKRQIPSLEQLCQGYGMTEQSMCSHLPVYGWHNVRAAGRLNPNFEMKIVDVQTRQPVELGQVGEICTRSPTTMIGYLNNPEATAETIDADGWLRTGDIGYCDEHGWTYVVDRLKELIKVKGLQVAPAELEDTLLSHPGIKDCAVVGVRDELCGEVPKAFVVRADATMGEEEVKNFIKDRLAAYKQLKYVEFVESIPKSPSGKILRRCLRQQK